MSTQLGSNPSFTWRSILEGRVCAVLEKGLIWRVGTRERIKITETPWVPTMPDFKVRMRENSEPNIEWVNQLILQKPSRLNSELIARVFDTQEANMIQQISLGQGKVQDNRYQMFDPKGQYSVKSGHEVIWNAHINQQRQDKEEYNQVFSLLSHYKKVWRSIWKMKIQPKTKIFTQRVAINILPTRSRLISKNIQVGNGCYLCDESTKEVWHVLNSCQYFRTALGVSSLQVQVQDNIQDLQAWLEWMQKELSSLPTKDHELMASIWEGVWYQRNQVWNGKPISCPFQLYLQQAMNLRCYKIAQMREGATQIRPDQSPEKQEAPLSGVFKINTDEATVENARTTGLGVIIRDSRGQFVAVRTRKIQGTADVMNTEALAVKEGLKLAMDLGFRAIILEGDAKVILESFERQSMIQSHVGLILAYAYRLAAGFSYFKAQFVSRAYNIIADKLAEIAKNGVDQDWTNEAPQCIRNALVLEAL